MSIESDFAEYRETSDPAALARVFDALAPELLLVAGHLVRGRGDAEDLVHQCFLKAIHHAKAWDAERPLRPWVVAILVNEARMERRRAGRRIDPSRVSSRPVPDPLDEAADREFAEELLHRIERLPPTYRHVLTLRYIHGLRPREIAQSLGRSPETVKTWLRRGREQLRKLLPAGFALSLQAMLSPQRSLAEVRDELIIEATRVQAEINATAIAAKAGSELAARKGVGALGKAGFALAAVAMIALAVFLQTREDPSSGAPLDGDVADSARVNAEANKIATAARLDAEDPASQTRALVVRYADGAPASEIHVRARPANSSNAALHERRLVSDERGRLDLAGLDAGPWTLRIARGGGDERVDLPLRDARALVVPVGIDVDGRVVDARSGRGIPAARVWVSDGERFDVGRVVARTDQDGRFRLRAVAPDRALSARADGFGTSDLTRVRASVEMQLAPGDRVVHGRVVDDRRQPLANARLWIGHVLRDPRDFDAAAGKHTAPILTRSADDGSFRVRGLRPYRRHVIWAAAPGHALTRVRVPLGAQAKRALELVVPRAAELRGSLDASEGPAHIMLRPAEIAREARRDGRQHGHDVLPAWVRFEADCRPGETFGFGELPPGLMHASAWSIGDARVAVAKIELRAGVAQTWQPSLVPTATMRGRLRDERGVAIAGLRVTASADGLRRPASAMSASDGRFEIRHCARVPYDLRVETVDGQAFVVAAATGELPAQDDMVIVVQRARLPIAGFTGRFRADLLDAAGSASGLSVTAQGIGVAHSARLEADGSFRLEALPVGQYRLIVRKGIRALWTGRRALTRAADAELGEILPGAPSAALDFVLTARGQAIDKTFAFLETDDGMGIVRMMWVDGGRCSASGVPAGRYRIRVQIDGSSYCCTPTFRIDAGAAASKSFTLAGPKTQRTRLILDTRLREEKLRGFVTIRRSAQGRRGATVLAFGVERSLLGSKTQNFDVILPRGERFEVEVQALGAKTCTRQFETSHELGPRSLRIEVLDAVDSTRRGG